MQKFAWHLFAFILTFSSLNAAAVNGSGVYVFKSDVKLTPQAMIVNGEADDDRTGTTITFTKDEPIVVRFISADEVSLSLLLEEEERGTVPEQIILSSSEFARAGLEYKRSGDEETLYADFSPYLPTEVAGQGRARRRMHYMGAGGCVAYVLRAIGWSGGRSGNGKDVTRTLRGRGWTAASCSSPPVGAVASWTGGRHGKGHTAIWNGRCWAYDLACASPGSKYHLRDCVTR